MMLCSASADTRLAPEAPVAVSVSYLDIRQARQLHAQIEGIVAYINAVTASEVGEYLHARALADYVASLPTFFVDTAHWAAINVCEEGGTWVNDGWTRDGHFQGGLGMSVEAWNEVVAEAPQYGFSLPSSSNMATPYQQMQGAQILYNRVGSGGWACKA